MRKSSIAAFSILLAYTLLLFACTQFQRKQTVQEEKVGANQEQLNEKSRELTTGVADALNLVRTNEVSGLSADAVALATDLARQDQRVEGLPLHPLDVVAILRKDAAAIADLETRVAQTDSLLSERVKLKAELDETRKQLEAMGQQYEKERNSNIVKRMWRWGTGLFGTAIFIGILVMLGPASLPLIGMALRTLVAKVPKLISFVGVVGKDAFDSAVKGVEEVKAEVKKYKDEPWSADEIMDTFTEKLNHTTDKAHRGIIDARKAVLVKQAVAEKVAKAAAKA